VPLQYKAVRLIERMIWWDNTLVFGLKSHTLDAMFRKYRKRAGLEGFTFHNARHTAATMLSRKLDVLDLCKAFGWTDPKMAMTYYNPTASDIAKRMR
jgi:integrase